MDDLGTWLTEKLFKVENGIVGLLAFIAGLILRGFNHRSGIKVASEQTLIQAMVNALEKRVDDVERRAEERSIKQAEAHRSEIERIELLYREELTASREREAKLREQLARSDVQLAECAAEKREANHRLAQMMADNQRLQGEIAILRQQVNGVEKRQTDTEHKVEQVRQTTDKLRLPSGPGGHTE